jgi:hypothetical protein
VIAHLVLHSPLVLLWWTLAIYGAGLLYWEFSVFFRADYFRWADVWNGFMWPVWWIRRNRGR